MSKAVLAWLGVLFVVMGGTLLWLGYKYTRPDFDVHVSTPEIDRDYQRKPLNAGDSYLTAYTLVERSGKERGTEDLAGKVSVTNFFFSTCKAECLRQQTAFDRLQREFAPQGVQFVSITVDPEIDTPSRLATYARQFEIARQGDGWWFLTGSFPYIQRIAYEIYGVPLGRRLEHTEKFSLRDKWGNPRGNFDWKDDKSLVSLKLKLAELTKETEPPPDVVKEAEERAGQIARLKEREAQEAAEKAKQSETPAPEKSETEPDPSEPVNPATPSAD